MTHLMRKAIAVLGTIGIVISTISLSTFPASAADPAAFTVEVKDSSAAEGAPTLGGAFVSLVATTNVDLNADALDDVTAGGIVTGGTTIEGEPLTLKLPNGDLIPDGSYKLVVSKSGFGVATASATVASGAATAVISLTATTSAMKFVNAFGAQMTAVVADGQPCVFYGTTSSVPSFYRSTDCGGTWAPVTLARDEKVETTGDDGLAGMDGTAVANSVTTSNFPGEVAAVVGSNVWFSRDFGTTWLSFTKPTGLISQMKWVHSYDSFTDVHSSYMFFVMGENGSVDIKVVSMPTSSAGTVIDPTNDPLAAAYTATTLSSGKSFKASASDLVAFAAGMNNVYVAVQKGAAGTKVFKIAAGTPSANIDASNSAIATSQNIPGLTRDTTATAADILLFGGGMTENGNPRSLIVWDRFDDNTAKSRAATLGIDETWTASDGTIYGASSNTTPESFTSVGGQQSPGSHKPTCGENNTPAVGSMAPVTASNADTNNWQGIGALGMARSCIVMHVLETRSILGTTVPAGAVLILDVPGANNNTGSAFSAGFNLTTDNVVISGDGARGLVKGATFKAASGGPAPSVKANLGAYNYRPLFPEAAHVAENYLTNRADPGLSETSGGFAINGITSPTVKDVATNPIDATGLLMGFSFTGGGRTVMSTNGGDSFFTVGGGGSNATTWWLDAEGNYWIAGGSSGNSNAFFSARQFTQAQYDTIKADVAAGLDPDSPDYDANKRLTFGEPFRASTPNNAFGSKSFGLGDMQGELTGLVGIVDTKKVIVSAARGNQASGIAIATLTGTGKAVDFDGDIKYLKSDLTFGSTPTDGGAFTNLRITSIQYCPAGSADTVADKAFFTLADESGSGSGTVRVISGVSTESPTASNPYVGGLDLAGADNLRDLKIECDTGAMLIGARAAGGGGGGGGANTPKLYVSLDGAAHWVDVTPTSTAGLPQQINNLETVAIETNPLDGVSQLVAVSNSGDVVAVEFDLNTMLDPLNLTLADLKDGAADPALANVVDQQVTMKTVNNSSSPEGFAFGGESPGDIEIPPTASEISVVEAKVSGMRMTVKAVADDPIPMLGSGAGALETVTTAASGGGGGGGSTPVSSTISVNGWDAGVSKPLTFGQSLSISTNSNAGAVLISSDAKCSVTGSVIKAMAGSGTCLITFRTNEVVNTYLATSVTRSITLGLAPVATPKVIAPKLLKTVKLTASTLIGGKKVTYVWASATTKTCTVSKGVLKGVKAGACKITVSAAAVTGFTSALSKKTISLVIKK